MERDPGELLDELRGMETTCGCGRPLIPHLNVRGEQIGVTHTPEDDEWHAAYFGSIQVRRGPPDA